MNKSIVLLLSGCAVLLLLAGCPKPGPTPHHDVLCGSRGLAACPAEQYCKFDANANCGITDIPGVCTQKPSVERCSHLYAPICGCDGKTYGNACEAASAGIAVDHQGECVPLATE
ncbi:hypothetical protein VU08_06800 [Desulfobulbus sp. F5]|nr:hypothetical protein [Desulfobulbus sp. F5]